MPSYVYTLSVPRRSTVDQPAEVRDYLPAGEITRIEFVFPPGPQGEVRLRVLLNDTQVAPARTGQWLWWDAGVMSVPVGVVAASGENLLVIQAVSPDANFDHTVLVKVDLEAQQALPMVTDLGADERLRRVVGGEG